MIGFYRFQSFFVYCCHSDIDFIGKSITWLVNSTLNCDWKPISHSASLRDSCDGFRVQFVNVEFPRQVMNFPIEPGADLHRFPPFYGNRSDFSYNKLKSGKWFGQSVNTLSELLRKPGKGTLGDQNSKKFSTGNRSVCTLDPLLRSICPHVRTI